MLRFHQPQLEKTRLCERPDCRHCTSKKCWFATNNEELRCRTFATQGFCPVPFTTEQPGFANDGRLRCPQGLHTSRHGNVLSAPAYVHSFLTSESPPASYGDRPRVSQPAYILPLYFYHIPQVLEAAIAKSKEELMSRNAAFRSAAERFLIRIFGDADAIKTAELSIDNMDTLLPAMLFVDQAQKTHDMRRYDISSADLAPLKDMWVVKVPSLAEKRPSVLRGDKILLHDRGTGQVHAGFVHFVNVDSVVISFDNRQKYNGPFDVYFNLPLTTWRQAHRAVHGAFEKKVFLDVSMTAREASAVRRTVQLRQSAVPLTPMQTKYIDGLFSMPRQLHLLWGPPGTGKTTTLVAALGNLALLLERPETRLLVVCPSNAAVDVIATRMVVAFPQLKDRMMRVNSLTRGVKDVTDPDLRRICTNEEAGGFRFPTKRELEAPGKIVFATLSTASRIYSVIGNDVTFDFIACDEAGQATEAELLQALVMADAATTRFLVAGDHKQLGPILPPALADVPAARSPLERLMRNVDPAQLITDQDDGAAAAEGTTMLAGAAEPRRAITVLVDNFRSDEGIVAVFNPTYGNVLAPRANLPNRFVNARRTLWSWITAPAVATAPSGLALAATAPSAMFIHVDGIESRDEDSPSWLNQAEKDAVLKIVTRGLWTSAGGVNTDDVAVLSPYAKQVQKIRGSFHFENSARVPSVASVEMFQGREAPIVVISTVRSRVFEELGNDVRRHLGFLRQPQRLNVAVSRPQALLVIVGNGNLLRCDPEWARILGLLEAAGAVLSWAEGSRGAAAKPYLPFADLQRSMPALSHLQHASAVAAVTADEVVYQPRE